MANYVFPNGTAPTTAAFVKKTTNAVITTMLQLKCLTVGNVAQWEWSGDAAAAATPGQVELFENTAFATVTAYVSGDPGQQDAAAINAGDPGGLYLAAYTTSSSGYVATVEGTVAAYRLLAMAQLIAPTNEFIEQFPQGFQPFMAIGKSDRVRATFGTAINAYCAVTVNF